MRLTEKTIRGIAAPESGYKLVADSELPGFGLRITAAGVRTFVLTYQAGGRQRRASIGRWDAWSATAARNEAKALRRRIDAGEDPLALKEQRRSEPTFGEIVGEYFATVGPNQRRAAEYIRSLERDGLPQWRNVRARDIARRDVIRLIEKKAETAPTQANRVFEILRRVFAWAVRRDLLESSPCLFVSKPAPEKSRDRILTPDEIRILWRRLDGPGFGPKTAAILRLILSTAQRPGEVCGARWSEFDLDNAVWTIPAARVKSDRAHRVPLNRTAAEILRALPGGGEFCFPSPTGIGHVHVNAPAHAIRNVRGRKDEPLEVEHFRPHDLRRSAASIMAGAGVSRLVLSKVLNHSEGGGATRIYDKYEYFEEMRRAVDTLDRRLRAILADSSGKVVSIA